MVITLQDAINGVADFAELDAIPHMPNGVKKVGAYIAIDAAKKNPSIFTKPYEPYMKMIGVLSEDGSTVDMDALAGYLRSAFEKVPTVTMWDFRFDAKDVEKLISRMGVR